MAAISDHPWISAAAQIATGICGTLSRGANGVSHASQTRSTRTPASQLVVMLNMTPS
jgi:hypothetical protein